MNILFVCESLIVCESLCVAITVLPILSRHTYVYVLYKTKALSMYIINEPNESINKEIHVECLYLFTYIIFLYYSRL